MSENKNNYTVYMHISPSEKRYIGITSMKPEKRWLNGEGYKNQMFYRAIQKYGWDSFNHEILFEGLTKEEAEQKEIELIAYYNSNQSDYGYNIENGGNSIGKHSEETKKKISKFNKGKVIPEETKRKMSESGKGKNAIPVIQYTKDGEFVKRYNSMTDAMNDIGYGTTVPTLISACCNNEVKSAYGYIWRLEGDILTDDYLHWCSSHDNNYYTKPICQYNRNGEFVNEYNSVKESSLITNINAGNITLCCKGVIKTAGNYIWRYKNDKLTKEHIEWCNSNNLTKLKKSVLRYSKNMDFIDKYDSVSEASLKTNTDRSSITACCRGKQKTAGGYIWRYANE